MLLFTKTAVPSTDLPGWVDKWIPVLPSIVAKRECHFKMTDLVGDLDAVNNAVNSYLTYVSDGPDNREYWAPVSETIATRQGDCEDFAMVKMATMLDIGWPRSLFSIATMRSRKDGIYHAVLVCTYGGLSIVLDNNANRIILGSEPSVYLPLYAYGIEQGWRYE